MDDQDFDRRKEPEPEGGPPVKDESISDRLFRTLFDSVYDAVFIHEFDGRIIDVNARVLSMYGVTREEALGMDIVRDFSSQDNDIRILPTLWNEVCEGASRFFEWKAQRPHGGSTFDADVFLTRVFLDGRYRILAHVQDVSERKHNEQQLMLFGKVFENVIEGILITDPAGSIITVNPAFSTITGFSRNEVIGQESENPEIEPA